MSVDSVLNQIVKFSGVPAKFSGGATRQVTVQAIINPAFLTAQDFADSLLNRLQNNEWSIDGNQINIIEVDGGRRWNVNFTANVESQYSTQDVQQSILDVLTNYFNITPQTITATVNGASDNPFHAGNVYVAPVKGTGGNSVIPVQTPTNNAQPKPKGFLDAFIDSTTGKVTAVGIGVGVVILLVVVTQKK